jgi:hypothetical protein
MSLFLELLSLACYHCFPYASIHRCPPSSMYVFQWKRLEDSLGRAVGDMYGHAFISERVAHQSGTT